LIIFHLHKDLTMKYSLKGVAGQGRVYKNGRGNIHARHFFWRSHTFAHIVISFKLLFFRIQMFWIIVVFIHKKNGEFPTQIIQALSNGCYAKTQFDTFWDWMYTLKCL